MVLLKEKEICPKKDMCMFAEDNGQKCLGCVERNSCFSCELDFLLDVDDFSQSVQLCDIRL